MSLSLANRHASLPVAYRLYLPKDWAEDAARRRKTGVPEDIGFKTKPEIALEQIEAACKAGLPRGVVLMDAGYGCNRLRAGVTALGQSYVAGIMPNTSVWISGERPGLRRKKAAATLPDTISVKELALGLRALGARSSGGKARDRLSSRFARMRVRVRIVINGSRADRKNGC